MEFFFDWTLQPPPSTTITSTSTAHDMSTTPSLPTDNTQSKTAYFIWMVPAVSNAFKITKGRCMNAIGCLFR